MTALGDRYDENGNLLASVDARGKFKLSSCDALDRVTGTDLYRI